MKIAICVIAGVLACLVVGCRDVAKQQSNQETRASSEPPGSVIPTPDDLLTTPSQISINGHTYVISAFLWRDFMPFHPPGGRPLIAVVHVMDVDSLALPDDMSLDCLWVVNGSKTWATEFTDEKRPPQSNYTIERVAREGPKWGPGVAVDVVARVRIRSIGEFRILIRDQTIVMTQ